MLTNAEIAQRFHTDEELRHDITLDLGKFTVSLFALDEGVKAETCFAGTGTLVAYKDRHYILTASHVWHSRLKHSSQIGIPLPANITNSFRIETASVEVASDLKAMIWNEWGPDMILLRIPTEYVAEISTHRIFYEEEIDGKPRAGRTRGH